jgi:deoxyribodipyrimidine photolyase-related protein
VRTVWILGDQLHRDVASLTDASPADTRVLLVESEAKLASKRWHRQRLHLVLTAMRRFGDELRAEGFDVDNRRAPTMAAGLAAHRAACDPSSVRAMEPLSEPGARLLAGLGVEVVPNDQLLCDRHEFAAWASGRTRLRLEDFYRWQRTRLGYLMEGDQPVGGRWNFDAENREPPPRDGRSWPTPVRTPLDALDAAVLADLPATAWGADPVGWWATDRAGALARLDHAVAEVLPRFGPHEDAMLRDSWHLAHSLLSPALNLGLLHPREVCEAVQAAWDAGTVPVASAEGFLRQVLGWREYVYGSYWLRVDDYRSANALDAHRPLPPALRDGTTEMACVAHTVAGLRERGWNHHIERLMVIGNLALLAGVEPQALNEWMWASYVDGGEWVMLPNVVGMALHADGGRMATKPYAAGGAYLNRMSDHCRGCRYDPRRRVGADACPFTTLYWDFLDRHRDRFASNHRMGNQLASLRRLRDLEAVRARAGDVLAALDAGEL